MPDSPLPTARPEPSESSSVAPVNSARCARALALLSPDAVRRFNAELEALSRPPPPPPPPPPPKPREPTYKDHRSLWQKLFGYSNTGGCAGCAKSNQRVMGWFEQQCLTPQRMARLCAWMSRIPARGWSLGRTILSWRCSSETAIDRGSICGACPELIHYLRPSRGVVREELHCGACDCPRTRLARLDEPTSEPRWTAIVRWFLRLGGGKNRKRGWRCPKGLHPGSDGGALFRSYEKGRAHEMTE